MKINLLSEIHNKNSIVIFGCGENGRIIFDYFKKNAIGKNVICFADNNSRKVIKRYKGKKIVRPEVASKLCKDLVWIISSPKNSLQMQHQLEDMQIKKTNIIQLTQDDIRYMYKSIHKYWYDEDKYFMYDYGFAFNLRFVTNLIKDVVYGKYYDFIIKRYPLESQDFKEYKYNVSICAIFLNEAPYLREWIEFHKMVGVEHFYLYNNMSTDNFKHVLNSYEEDDLITLIDWNIPHGQVSAYKNCIKRFSGQTRWIGFIDLDEFVVPRKNKIYDFLKQYNYQCGAILIYWRTFGSSGKIKRNLDELVTVGFKKCWSKLEDVGKCFYNTAYILSDDKKNGEAFFHICWINIKGKDVPPVNIYGKVSIPGGVQRTTKQMVPIQINHYIIKSYEEYQKKIVQPDAVSEKNPRTNETFYYYDKRAISTDNMIDLYLPELKQKLKHYSNMEEIVK